MLSPSLLPDTRTQFHRHLPLHARSAGVRLPLSQHTLTTFIVTWLYHLQVVWLGTWGGGNSPELCIPALLLHALAVGQVAVHANADHM